MPGERLVVRAYVPGERVAVPRLDVDLVVGDGITVVTGPSGAGKSTLLATVAGLLSPSRGRVTLDGAVLFDSELGSNVPTHQRRVALVFQSLALFPHLPAWENVAYGLPAMPKRQRRERATAWLKRAGVGELADRFPASLSGGEAQRVALARALASEPRVLLLDEPFSALDPVLRRALGSELRVLVEQAGVPTLLVTHDRDDTQHLASQVITLDRGRVVPA